MQNKVVRFKAGLGNQMFQYTFLRYLELTEDCKDVLADFSYYTKSEKYRITMITDFNLCVKTIDDNSLTNYCFFNHNQVPHSFIYRFMILIEILFNRNYYFEKKLSYHSYNSLIKYKYYDGYWQSWRYAGKIRDNLIRDFSLKSHSSLLESLINDVQSNMSVFVGIRRGDYYSSKKMKKRYDVCDNTYFEYAIKYMLNHLESPIFYIFSNDTSWVKQNIALPSNSVFVSSTFDLTDIEELILMSKCKHGIISNSTYHWWGAWLIENDTKIIIRPRLWFGDGTNIDIFPPEWIALEDKN